MYEVGLTCSRVTRTCVCTKRVPFARLKTPLELLTRAPLSNSTTVACFSQTLPLFSHKSLIIHRTVSLASFLCQFLCNLQSDYRYLRQILVGEAQIGSVCLLGIIIRVLLHFLLIHGDHKLDSNPSCVTNTNKLRNLVINFHTFASALSIHLVLRSR